MTTSRDPSPSPTGTESPEGAVGGSPAGGSAGAPGANSFWGAWRDRLRFRRWGKWIAGGFVGMALLGTVSVEVTSTSKFCSSCHIMGPYYDSWKNGSHKHVACVECHIEPGVNSFIHAKLNGLGQVVDDLLHRTSNKPSASVSQLSCTRSGCHSVETLTKSEIQNDVFKFRHDRHIGMKHLGVEITCATCHSHVRGDSHFEVSTDVCVNCHLIGVEPDSHTAVGNGSAAVVRFMARDPLTGAGAPTHAVSNGEKVPPDNCTACHDPPRGEVEFQGLTFDHSRFLSFGASCESCHRGVTAKPPDIDDGRCLQCHNFGLERALTAKEMHRTHTIGKHKIECNSCHGYVRHGAKVQVASMEQFECANCHKDQHAVQRTNYFNVDAHPTLPQNGSNPMFLAHVDCTGCHVKPRPPSSNAVSGAMVLAASPQACDKCHQAGYGERMVPLWQNATRKMYDQARTDLAAVTAARPGNPEAERVKSILDQVEADGSWGVHNPVRTKALLEEARSALAALKPSTEPAR